MMQMRTHTCGALRLGDAGAKVKLCGWMENVREVSGNLAFLILRDFYGTTQVVVRGCFIDGSDFRTEQRKCDFCYRNCS